MLIEKKRCVFIAEKSFKFIDKATNAETIRFAYTLKCPISKDILDFLSDTKIEGYKDYLEVEMDLEFKETKYGVRKSISKIYIPNIQVK